MDVLLLYFTFRSVFFPFVLDVTLCIDGSGGGDVVMLIVMVWLLANHYHLISHISLSYDGVSQSISIILMTYIIGINFVLLLNNIQENFVFSSFKVECVFAVHFSITSLVFFLFICWRYCTQNGSVVIVTANRSFALI